MPKVINEDEVFQAVLALLIARGYEGSTTRELAEAAGMHEATLFRKYGSKVGLIEQAITQQLATTPMSKVRYSGDLRADLKAILQSYIATVREHGEIMPLLLVEIPRHPELKQALKTPLANVEGIARVIERYQREGSLMEEPPMLTVSVLLAPIMVNELVRRVFDDWPSGTIELAEYVDAFLQGRRV